MLRELDDLCWVAAVALRCLRDAFSCIDIIKVDSVLSSKVLKPLGYARHAVGRSSVILQASPSVFCITLNVNFILLQLQANGTLAATLQQ